VVRAEGGAAATVLLLLVVMMPTVEGMLGVSRWRLVLEVVGRCIPPADINRRCLHPDVVA